MLGSAHGPFRVLLWALRQTGARPSGLRRLTWAQVRDSHLVISLRRIFPFVSVANRRLFGLLHAGHLQRVQRGIAMLTYLAKNEPP
jgi:hypothetical protein